MRRKLGRRVKGTSTTNTTITNNSSSSAINITAAAAAVAAASSAVAAATNAVAKMIDPADLQAFLSKTDGGAVAVDLLKIGQTHHLLQPSSSSNSGKNKFANAIPPKYRVALDIESCLDRFYGGYYSDWACGGQWNRAYQFVQLLATAFTTAHIEVFAFFDGTLQENKKMTRERQEYRQRTNSVLRHILFIGTPPPKIWWLPPSGLRTCLRNALRSINIQVIQTVHDHTMEIIDYYREQKLDAIIGLHPDYIVANIKHYFSSHDLRLSYKGALETKEFLVSKLLSSLSLTADHLPFMAVFLNGYIMLDDNKMKAIYKKVGVDMASDDERVRKIAEIIRNSPTNQIEEFIKHLGLEEWASDIKESVEYYQRKGKFSGKKYLGSKKRQGALVIVDQRLTDTKVPSLASENTEQDEQLLKDLNLLTIEENSSGTAAPTAKSAVDEKKDKKKSPPKDKGYSNFVYTLPGEVLKISLTRHQRGIMDARIYQILTKKEIVLPQVLEDEHYRDIPSVHIFYRPARQMIYAILFNLYHQKYLCSNQSNKEGTSSAAGGSKDSKANQKGNTFSYTPDITVSEWVWSPQNEYKTADTVHATPLPWGVPTIQRLWFGTAFEDKQRRMKAFLTVMRSDSPLMLNRGYVPQHMLVMACVLRYIVTNPDRKILSRQELDAFLATAFSPQLLNVDFTQELVLPGVDLRGVYLATLFMQGVETASLANDACGIPLPWMMTNPWLFFDGKLFHLKLKMSTFVQNLRELCDDQIDMVLKIERFRKAILEDVEHYLLPPQNNPLFGVQFLGPSNLLSKKNLDSLMNANGSPYITTPLVAAGDQAYYHRAAATGRAGGLNGRLGGHGRSDQQQSHLRGAHRSSMMAASQRGYQLKVGGVVVGSWADGGAQNRPMVPHQARLSRAGMMRYPVGRGRMPLSTRMHRTQPHNAMPRGVGRPYNNKLNRNRNKRSRKDKKTVPNRKDKEPAVASDDKKEVGDTDKVKNKNEDGNEIVEDNETKDESYESADHKDATGNNSQSVTEGDASDDSQLQNGTEALVSTLANSMCDVILKEDEDVAANSSKTTDVEPDADAACIKEDKSSDDEHKSNGKVTKPVKKAPVKKKVMIKTDSVDSEAADELTAQG